MKLAEAMQRLEACGTAQNRKVYARHGVRAKMFGVSYANQGKLKKAIGVDHALAQKLWATGNHDACVLATMVADPDASTAKELATWARTLDSYVVTDALAGDWRQPSAQLREGLAELGESAEVFVVPVPKALGGKPLAESGIGAKTGLLVVGVQEDDGVIANPPAATILPPGGELAMLGDADQRHRFAEVFE